MTWLAIASVYGLLCAVYVFGHQLGYAKGRREAWSAAQHVASHSLAELQRLVEERDEEFESTRSR